ncbi:Uncharacterized membrane-anchored protein YitT, contains DUF161 and DUF2179 domains [Lachnospiraceae bacterium XBB1006]|nr:Uncharacterized membrane-anchored protein YitT, contains DUF161 and DUF2179 domains [Lachnospiraceae bacterium XBB1006]
MLKKEDVADYARIIGGCLLFSFSVNVFVVPAGMYNGGIYGLSQIIRTLLVQYAHLALPSGFDIAGIINFALNVPLFYIAYRFVSKQFFSRTLFGLVIQTIVISLIPIPSKPVFDDPLLDALIGGLITGYGLGLILRSKGCSGGVDIIGIYFLKKDIKVTVGKISILVNAVIYLICAAMFDLNIACYSVIYAAIISYTMDRTHYQSINMLCFIITKNKELQKRLTQEIGRGVTYWDGKGAFSAEEMNVNAVVISKYEVKALKRIVNEIDPDAFVFMSEGITVDGYYLKKL